MTLDPGYRVFSEDGRPPLDVARRRRRQPGPVRARASRAPRAALDRYLAERRRDLPDGGRPLPVQHLRRPPAVARAATCSAICRASPGCCCSRSTGSSPASSRDNRLRQILGYPAVFLGTSPDRAPSMYHLMSHLDLDDGVRYPLGGFAELIDRIAALARAEPARDLVTGRARHRDPHRGRRATTARRPASSTGMRRAVCTPSTPTSWSRPPTCTTPRPRCSRRRCARYPEKVVGPPRPGSGRRARDARRARAAAAADPPQPVLHHGLGGELPDRSTGRTPASRTRRRSTSACRARPTRTSRRTATRTCSCSSPCRPTSRSAPEESTERATGAIERAADAAIAQIAAWAGIPDLAERIVVRRTVGPGGLRDRPERVAGRRARTGAHPAAERVLPPGERVQESRRPALRRVAPRSRASACRCA